MQREERLSRLPVATAKDGKRDILAKHHANGARAVTLPAMPTMWDTGASGPANRVALVREQATDMDPVTGRETKNPNNVTRYRRAPWVYTYHTGGYLTAQHVMAAHILYSAAHGISAGDPLAAIIVDGGLPPDRQAANVDRRAAYRALWARIPKASQQIVLHVVIDEQCIWHGNSAQRQRHMRRLREGLDAIG